MVVYVCQSKCPMPITLDVAHLILCADDAAVCDSQPVELPSDDGLLDTATYAIMASSRLLSLQTFGFSLQLVEFVEEKDTFAFPFVVHKDVTHLDSQRNREL